MEVTDGVGWATGQMPIILGKVFVLVLISPFSFRPHYPP